MGSRIGVILHEDWANFSPLLYHHFGEGSIVIELQNYLRDYVSTHSLDNHDGHKYSSTHMMVGFLHCLKRDIHIRVENLSDKQIETLQSQKEYPNCFDGGCWIVNVSTKNYGETVCGSRFYLDNNNIVNDELRDKYDDGYWK